MKSFIATLLCIVLVFFSGAFVAAGEHYIPKARENEPAPPRMQSVDGLHIPTWANICIAYDTQTGVMYLISRAGGICPMVDASGQPLLYQSEE